MSVKINIPPFLVHLANETQIAVVEGTTIDDCLKEFGKRFPNTRKLLFDDEGKLREYIDVYLNGKSIYLEGLSKLVADGDELDVLFVITGG